MIAATEYARQVRVQTFTVLRPPMLAPSPDEWLADRELFGRLVRGIEEGYAGVESNDLPHTFVITVDGERPRDADALLHPARELRRLAPRRLRHLPPDQLEIVVRAQPGNATLRSRVARGITARDGSDAAVGDLALSRHSPAAPPGRPPGGTALAPPA